MPKTSTPQASATAGAAVFALFVAIGAAFIVFAKMFSLPTIWITVVPLLLILGYAGILTAARYLRLRTDQAGDNLYYLGFLFTLTSLGVSLWEFSSSEGADSIVTNFGIAVSSTILGVALRVIFNQMRQDPAEVERTARLELAEAARRVRQELDSTVFELSGFRRASQQVFADSAVELRQQAERIASVLFDGMRDLPERSAAPLSEAYMQAKETLEKLAQSFATVIGDTLAKLRDDSEELGTATRSVAGALQTLETRIQEMQTPESVIEIKLQPTIRSLTKALKEFSSDQLGELQQLRPAIQHLSDAIRASNDSAKAAEVSQEQHSDRLATVIERGEQNAKTISDHFAAVLGEIQQQNSSLIALLEKQRQNQVNTLQALTGLEQRVVDSMKVAPRSRSWFGS